MILEPFFFYPNKYAKHVFGEKYCMQNRSLYIISYFRPARVKMSTNNNNAAYEFRLAYRFYFIVFTLYQFMMLLLLLSRFSPCTKPFVRFVRFI